jgi:tetratricopeptide (TPR) repeat protein
MTHGRRACLALALALLARTAAPVQSDDSDDQALLADADYAAGRGGEREGEAAVAFCLFSTLFKRFPDAADLHNELGFAHRKLRQMDKAFVHYKRALAIKPDHRGAHEYIGEAYLMVDDMAGAERHLAELRRICLLPCEEARELQQAIADYRVGRKP